MLLFRNGNKANNKRDKGQTLGPNPQNETAQIDQRREEPVYPVGFTPLYAPNVHMAQAPPMQQAGGFPYGYAPPRHG